MQLQFLSVFALAIPALVSAQYGDPAPAPSSSSSAAPAFATNVHQVSLGVGNSVTFTPNTVTAKVNDTILFTVDPSSKVQHSVVEMDPSNPCIELKGGFNSGLMSPSSSFAVVVNVSTPVFLFCGQIAPIFHCENAMVLIINPANPSDITSLMSAASAVTNEPTQTSIESVGVDIVETATPTPTGTTGGSSGGSNGAVKGSVTLAATLLTTVLGFFVVMA